MESVMLKLYDVMDRTVDMRYGKCDVKGVGHNGPDSG